MKEFFRQMRERHVVKVGIAYLVAAWVVLQLADVIIPALGLPEWAISLTLGVLALGFPLALVLAWIFDITPEGIQRTDELLKDTPDAALAPVTNNAHSIAVLPFRDMSAEHDQEHFNDGLTEELLSVLTRIPGLRVASRTSSFAFKGKTGNLKEVAEKLRVDHVLEGSVRKDGNRIRVTAQLIEVASDSQLWAVTYDRELCDIFAIQDDIAGQILEALKIRLGKGGLPDPTTADAKAYEYFLRGRGYGVTRGKDDADRAIEMFQKAVSQDPGFVRAWISLAEHSAMKTIFFGGGQDSCTIACNAAEHAMKLAPHRPDSFMARGFSHMAAHRYAEAEGDFQKAIELDARHPLAYHYLARSRHHQGRVEEALRDFITATEMDLEDWESPTLAVSHLLGKKDAEGARNMAAIAIDRIGKHLEDYPENPRAWYLGVGAQVAAGERVIAREWAERALELAPDEPTTRYNIACFYSLENEPERALDLLEGSIQSRSWIENDTDLDNIRSHPRYLAFIDSLPG